MKEPCEYGTILPSSSNNNGKRYQRASPSAQGGGTLLAPVDNPVIKLPCPTTAHKFGMPTNDERAHIGSSCDELLHMANWEHCHVQRHH
jgi:hypothetical protein